MVSPRPSSVDRICLGGFVLDLARRELLTLSGSAAPLRHKALEVLLMLGTQAGHVVSKDDLLAQIWPSVVVTEDSLTQAIAEIRRCLGDTQHRWIRTVVRRGYCLQVEAAPASADAGAETARARAAWHNLPVAHGPLLGRDTDLSAVHSLVLSARLVTVAGTGGIGKTRLALAAAQSVAAEFSNGGWWVDLALAPGALPLAPSVAAAVRIDLPPGEPLVALVSALRDEQGLLVLDNCEHRVDEVASLASALLGGAQGLHLLATSQEPLKVSGEQVYRLAPLECPAVGATLEEARSCAAFALIERRAREADHNFSIDGRTLPAAIELCSQLDGIPLALEMAAARLPAVGVGVVQRLLGERLTLLKRMNRGTPARHETLQATLAWSCSLLDDVQRAALDALAGFCGPFESTMARMVMAPGTSEAACVDTLCALVDKSLLSVELGEPVRYRLYESMRVYASARVRNGGDRDAAPRRHAQAMAAHAEELRRVAPELAHEALLARFGPSYADFETAFVLACEQHDCEVAAQTLTALRLLDQLRGDVTATRRWLLAARPLAFEAQGRARAHIELMRASTGWVEMPEWPSALAAEEAVQAWRALGDDPAQLHHALMLLGKERARAGDCDGAQRALDEAATLRAAGGSRALDLLALVLEGHVSVYCGRWQEGLDRLRAALALARQSGKTRLACYVLIYLAEAATLSDDPRAALQYSETAIREARACRAQQYLALALLAQIEAALGCDDVHAATELAAEALTLAARYGVHTVAAAVFSSLAFRTGRTSIACRALGYALLRQSDSNARDARYAQILQALRSQAEAELGSKTVSDLLRSGEQLGGDALFALLSQVIGTDSTGPAG
ncbi:winged helix-turn-helix domain-containing protein [Variovorax sp. YR752]|uniref:ATP-binding protein n=1 Tax=Variovorax sp. YR752 TaxID=1884383 RepID=UPI003137B1B7